MTLATEPTNANDDVGDDAADSDDDNTNNKNSLLLKRRHSTKKGQLQEQYKNIKNTWNNNNGTNTITRDE